MPMIVSCRIAALLTLLMVAAAHAQESHFGSSFYGRWAGSTQLGPTPLFVQIEAQPKSDGVPLIVHVPAMALFGSTPTNMTRDGNSVVFDVKGRGAVLEVSLEPVEGDPETLQGKLAFTSGPPAVTNLPPSSITLTRQPNLAELDDVEQFNAALEIPNGGSLGMSIRLAEIDSKRYGTIDIPAQGIQNLVMECSEAQGTLTLILPVPSPARMTLAPVGDGLSGRFIQGGIDLPITFTKGAVEVVVNTRTQRPQEPNPPFPYDVAEMTVPTRAGHTLAGTLFVPRDIPPQGVPIVVLVTGSGPQDRDEMLMNHKPFLVLADRLARQGVASFRYDDRGVGKSGGNFSEATTQDFANDAAAALAHILKDPRLDATRSGIIGHSEGGTVAAIVGAGEASDYQDQPRPRFVVMLAGPGVSGHEILREQMKQLLIAEGVDAEMVNKISAAQGELLDASIANANEETLLEKSKALQDLQIELNGSLLTLDEEQRAKLASRAVESLSSPWMSYFLRFDPRPSLRKLDMPVLAVNGTLDSQVWHEQNLPEIEKAIGEAGGEVTIMRVDGLNHLLQPAKTGAVSEYETIDITMDEATLAKIGEWINAVKPTTR